MIKYSNPELQKQYDGNAKFRKKAEQLEYQYQHLQARSSQLQESMLINDSILEHFPSDTPIELYFWYGMLQPLPGEEATRLTLNFVRLFKPSPGRKFVFVYFNHHTSSSDYFFEFKNIFLLLPLSFLEHLKGFILVKPSLYMRAVNLLSLGDSLSDSYVQFENCAALCKALKLDVDSFATFVPEAIAEEFPELREKRLSLTLCRLNIQGQTMTEKERQDKREFDLAINAFLTKQVYTLDNFEEGELGVPKILELLVCYFKDKPEGLSQEGIFRKSVSIDEEQYIMAQLGQGNYTHLNTVENPFMIACLIKRFFYNLKVPLVPFPHYQRLMADQSLANVSQVVRELPPKNYRTLVFILDFLRRDVLPKESANKMNAYNIAVCFSQSFMRSEVESLVDLANAKLSVAATNTLITCFQDIFEDQEGRKDLFRKRVIQQKEQFEKTVKLELSIDMENRFSEDEIQKISFFITSDAEEQDEAQLNLVADGLGPIIMPAQKRGSEEIVGQKEKEEHSSGVLSEEGGKKAEEAVPAQPEARQVCRDQQQNKQRSKECELDNPRQGFNQKMASIAESLRQIESSFRQRNDSNKYNSGNGKGAHIVPTQSVIITDYPEDAEPIDETTVIDLDYFEQPTVPLAASSRNTQQQKVANPQPMKREGGDQGSRLGNCEREEREEKERYEEEEREEERYKEEEREEEGEE